MAGRWVLLARQAGAQHAGVNYGRLEAGHDGAPPHCHSADEELFVFLEGQATFELWPSPLDYTCCRFVRVRRRARRAAPARA